MTKENVAVDDDGTNDSETTDTVEKEINAFAAKLGQDTGNKYSCYVYRMVTDEETGRKKKPFCKKYVGVEPDPMEIAERFRGGTYLVQFIWYANREQKSKAYTLDVDTDAFPPLPKTAGAFGANGQLIPSNISEQMQLQMMTISSITEVLKAAYTNNKPDLRADPLEQFSGVMEVMEGSFTRAMQLNQKVMERVYLKSMEKKYGLDDVEITQSSPQQVASEETGIIGKYAPIIKQVVDGLSQIFSMFGDKVPKEIVQRVKSDNRFKSLLSDPKALVVIGTALKREFGQEKANEIMRMFGVKMVPRPISQVTVTPSVPLDDSKGHKNDDSRSSDVSHGLDGGKALKVKVRGKVDKGALVPA